MNATKHFSTYFVSIFLVACASGGQVGLSNSSTKWDLVINQPMQKLSDCITDRFNSEPYGETGVGDINTHVSMVSPRDRGLMLASINSENTWMWTIYLSSISSEKSGIQVTARTGDFRFGYWQGNDYIVNKVKSVLAYCGAK
jgi:hypothetical protein